MKKSLIALAVLAASGTAMAQSSVQVYGIMDVWFGNMKSSVNAANPAGITSLDSGGLGSSRWGLQGSEDLGGGLKAVFKLEQGFNADKGTQSTNNTAFSRQAYVGLAGGFGQVTFGNTWTAIDDVMGAANSGFDSSLSATSGVWLTNAFYASNPGNTIKYNSPSFGGFSAAASYSLDEVAATSRDIVDFSVSYAAGPVTANFGYQVQNDQGGGLDAKFTILNGSYDLGVAKLLASYGQVKQGADKANEYQIGVDVPLSSALTVSAGYAKSSRKGAFANAGLAGVVVTNPATAFDGAKNSGYSVALAYALSKRTTVYGGVSSAKGENAAGVDVSKRQLYAVGLRHTF